MLSGNAVAERIARTRWVAALHCWVELNEQFGRRSEAARCGSGVQPVR